MNMGKYHGIQKTSSHLKANLCSHQVGAVHSNKVEATIDNNNLEEVQDLQACQALPLKT